MENNKNRSPKRRQVGEGTANKKASQTTRTAKQRGERAQAAKRPVKGKKELTPKQLARKRRNKILLFIAEIFVILLLLVVFWAYNKASKIEKIEIKEEDIFIDPEVDKYLTEETKSKKGYLNIALFGVDDTKSKLDGNTRTDTMLIASINQDTKEVRFISVLRDSYLNLSTDVYAKANSAYAKGGATQAINMMNMNLDLNIKDFVTIGMDGLVDVVEAVGGVEVYVTEEEISHLNNYQMCIVGEPDGTLNAAGEPNYYAEPYVEFQPVEEPGLQRLDGVQATAYCRIRYVGNDFGRVQRQQTVIREVAKQALKLNPTTLNNIAEAIFPKVATSLELSEILTLLADAPGYKIGESATFPFEGEYKTGNIGSKGNCVVPTTLEENVIKLHEFFFDSTEENYTPSQTVKKCSEKIYNDTAPYLK